jgi:ADP-ribosylglycohydrolase
MNIKDAVWGFVVGDALGVPYEFSTRHAMIEKPASGITGYGTYNQAPGTWSDDTSMMLCVLENIVNQGKPKDLAHLFLQWYNHNYMTANGVLFDIGNTTRTALTNMMNGVSLKHCGLSDEHSAGNGSLMRCIPYAFVEDIAKSVSDMIIDSRITHRHPLCTLSCMYYVKMLRAILEGKSKQEAADYAAGYIRHGWRISDADDDHLPMKEKFKRLFSPTFHTLPETEIKSTGYVIDTLEAAVWCFLNTDSYEASVLHAVNLGGDTDTIAALTGALSGLFYGYDSIPQHWISAIVNQPLIHQVVSRAEANGKYISA